MVQALWYPRIEILVTLFVTLIILYYFSLVVFTFFYDELDNYMILTTYTEYTQVMNGTKQDWVYSCSTLWMCYISLIDQTFKQTGSVGSYMVSTKSIDYEIKDLRDKDKYFKDNSYDGINHFFTFQFYIRFLFDNALNILIMFIMIRMLQGIIIDTFIQSREKLKRKINDQMQCCFICGISRMQFEKG